MALDPRVVEAVERVEGVALRAVERLEERRRGGRAARASGASGASDAAPRVPPGPPPRRRVLGSLGYYMRFLSDPFGFVAGRFARYGDIYYAPSADGGLYAIRHPDHLQEVLVTRAADHRKTHTAFTAMAEVLGTGLLTSDGPAWRRHRRMIQPAFSHARLAGYAAEMVDEAARAADRLRGAGERDVAEEMMELTLRAVSRTLFSHDVGDQAATFGRAMTALQDRLAAPGLVPGWLPTPQRARLRRAMAELDAILYALIASRRRAGPDAPRDLLQTLVTAVDEEGDGERLTEREVRDELITLFLAGHETTANALAWTFYLLSQHPEVEARLHAELDAVLGPPSLGAPPRPPAYDDLPRLPYVEQVIKESLRLYPPAFMVVRRAHQDTEIGGFPVPAGSEIVVWTYLTHRDPRWFPEPDRFRPERFAPDEEAKIPKLAYAPFGAGPRACIGKSFAMVEARLLLATLAHRLRFELPPGHHVEPEPRVTLRPKGGLRMTIRPR